MEGGELFDRVVNTGRFSEPLSKLFFYQMATAVQVRLLSGSWVEVGVCIVVLPCRIFTTRFFSTSEVIQLSFSSFSCIFFQGGNSITLRLFLVEVLCCGQCYVALVSMPN